MCHVWEDLRLYHLVLVELVSALEDDAAGFGRRDGGVL